MTRLVLTGALVAAALFTFELITMIVPMPWIITVPSFGSAAAVLLATGSITHWRRRALDAESDKTAREDLIESLRATVVMYESGTVLPMQRGAEHHRSH